MKGKRKLGAPSGSEGRVLLVGGGRLLLSLAEGGAEEERSSCFGTER